MFEIAKSNLHHRSSSWILGYSSTLSSSSSENNGINSVSVTNFTNKQEHYLTCWNNWVSEYEYFHNQNRMIYAFKTITLHMKIMLII